MHLYHVSFEEIESFTPRIPKWRCEGEDHTIDRICFSDEMSRCLASIPEAGNIMHAMRSMGYDPTLYVYTLDTSLLPEEAIWDYRKVSEYVPDAMGTHEYWVKDTKTDGNRKILFSQIRCMVYYGRTGFFV